LLSQVAVAVAVAHGAVAVVREALYSHQHIQSQQVQL
jgi:hypothetical protein